MVTYMLGSEREYIKQQEKAYNNLVAGSIGPFIMCIAFAVLRLFFHNWIFTFLAIIGGIGIIAGTIQIISEKNSLNEAKRKYKEKYENYIS